MSIYSRITSLQKKVCNDTVGLIQALLEDIPNDMEYDRWMTLVGIIKYEIEDPDQGFTIFNEFSSRFDSYSEDDTYKKFNEAGIEGTGSAKVGSLIHWLKEDLGASFNFSKYAKFYNSEEVSAVKVLKDKLDKAKGKLPDHILTETIEQVKMPSTSISAEIALITLLEEGKIYATATHPAREKLVDPYNGDELQQYISVNPIKKGTKRNQKNCEAFKYAVVEFDTISLDEQYSVLSAIDLPYEALVFTGGKSIHAWVAIDAADHDTYKKRTLLINKIFCDFGYSKEKGNGVDTLVLYDPSSWVRCPGAVRSSIKDGDEHTSGNIQKVLWAEKSEGWDYWYSNVYPKYVIESSISTEEEEDKEFEVPTKDQRFTRKLSQVIELLEGNSFLDEIKDIVGNCASEEVESTLNEAVTSFFQGVRKKSKNKTILTVTDLYHIFEESILSSGTPYEGDVREVLLKACYIANKFEQNRKAEYKDRLETEVESIKGKINKWVDPELIIEIDRTLKAAEDQGEEEYHTVLKSIEDLFEELDFRTAVLKKPEMYKYANTAGELLSSEFKELNEGSLDDIFYVYYKELQTFDRKNTKFDKVTTYTFPSVVTPYICFVQKDQKGAFKAVPLDDNSVGKLLASFQFLDCFKKVEVLSDVPVFCDRNGVAELITGYDAEKGILVVGDKKGYDFMDLERAKKIILDLFSDFKFVSKSDHSRAIASLLMPAMCHAGLLRGDFRPLAYIDADCQGAGKGTMVDFLTCPYVDSYALVTQDDASIGSIDEKIASSIKEGKNHIVIDNLKPTRKMKELSSSFIEAMMTANSISFRCAGERMTELDLRWAMMYVTTNGMPLSKDTAERSLYISLRKQDNDYTYKQYEKGLKNYLIGKRPEIMSAIFTILKEYVEQGKPMRKPEEKHRFLYSVPAVNYIITDIFDMPDITTGIRLRNEQKSGQGVDVVRAVCFLADKEGLLGQELTHLDMYELLSQNHQDSLLGLPYDEDIYSDEAGENIRIEAKKKIGTKFGTIFSKPNLFGRKNSGRNTCKVEEFRLTRGYDASSKSPHYTINKEE